MINCPVNKILNPKSNRCVKREGKIGRSILNSNCKDIYIKWSNNSCYMDSLLVALFNKKSKIIEDLIFRSDINDYNSPKLAKIGLKIREELLQIYKIISNQLVLTTKYTCDNLRILLDSYYKTLQKHKLDAGVFIDKHDNWVISQLDINDFFEFILKIFRIRDNTLKIRDGNNIIYSNFKSLIPIDFIVNKTKLKIRDIYPKYILKYKLDKNNVYIDDSGVKHNYFTKKYEILKGNLLFIAIYRNIGTIKNRIKIIPCELLKLKENNFNLYLSAIIIHYGENTNSGHYITLFKCNDIWFEYNDMNKNIKQIGKLKNIITIPEYTSNIIGIIYIK